MAANQIAHWLFSVEYFSAVMKFFFLITTEDKSDDNMTPSSSMTFSDSPILNKSTSQV